MSLNKCYHISILNTIYPYIVHNIDEELIKINLRPISAHFFKLNTLDLAKQLLGKLIVHEYNNQILVGKIVETEAYQGPIDRAAHSYRGRTKRNDVMYETPGSLYCYQMHTHTLVNVVAGPISTPHGILIRAVEPIKGIQQMRLNRPKINQDINLTNGPGKLTKALDITMDYYGHKWFEKPLYISHAPLIEEHNIVIGPRIGIANSGEAAYYPWRFSIKSNPYVSRYRK